ncbi:TlpA disulfide reductase family protein [Sphingobacterium sp. HMA12]|uniref:TlpA disulfide reductase family protein n=1 Tax=Sphingobacterium sp. HMA12 TaxID=2050894 RepID=UPI000CE9B185|nr:TlpA disulfide reductase family protein [Sphingobacterium sp. HMA12]
MNYKKYIVSALLLTITIGCFAQKAKVSGLIKGIGDAQVSISYLKDGKMKNDTVKFKKDRFIWEAELPEPQKVYFMFPSRYAELFLEAGQINITGHADSLHLLKAKGSKIQAEAERYQATLKDLEQRSSPLYQKWGKVTEAEQLKLEQELDQIGDERRSRAAAYIAAHPKSAYSLSLVSDRSAMGSYEEVKPLYDVLDKSVMTTATGKQLTQRLEVLKRSALGATILDFTQNDPEGKAISFNDFKGKYVLIDFWASWCGPCRAENPNVLKAYNKYKDSNFTVVGISLDDNAEKWKKAIKDDGMPWSQVSSLKGFENEVSTYYGIQGIPSTLLVDPDGKIIARNLRGASLQQKLSEIFNGQ